MESLSPEVVYDNLELLEQGDVTRSAVYREQAQEVLADPEVSLPLRQAIADRLGEANLLLTHKTVTGGDSY